jgi:chromosome segregation ATPase
VAEQHTINCLKNRKTALTLAAGAAALSLDVMSYPEWVRPAVLRAFGGVMLARDDDVAEQLATRFGLAAVTRDGTISRKGSVVGGAHPAGLGRPAAPAAGLLTRKLELQRLQVCAPHCFVGCFLCLFLCRGRGQSLTQ